MKLDILGDEEIDGLVPTDKEVDDYLATPDDEVAANLRETLDEETFRYLVKQILFYKKIAKAQAKMTAKQILEWGEELCECKETPLRLSRRRRECVRCWQELA